jgi:ribosome-associated protein
VRYPTDERSLAAVTEVEVFTGGGPGGQHRNKTQNAVRLHHRPSGLIVTATERRSLEANRKAAFERLLARLEQLNHVPKPRRKTRPKRGAVERRLKEKQQQARKKSDRRQRDD